MICLAWLVQSWLELRSVQFSSLRALWIRFNWSRRRRRRIHRSRIAFKHWACDQCEHSCFLNTRISLPANSASGGRPMNMSRPCNCSSYIRAYIHVGLPSNIQIKQHKKSVHIQSALEISWLVLIKLVSNQTLTRPKCGQEPRRRRVLLSSYLPSKLAVPYNLARKWVDTKAISVLPVIGAARW